MRYPILHQTLVIEIVSHPVSSEQRAGGNVADIQGRPDRLRAGSRAGGILLASAEATLDRSASQPATRVDLSIFTYNQQVTTKPVWYLNPHWTGVESQFISAQ